MHQLIACGQNLHTHDHYHDSIRQQLAFLISIMDAYPETLTSFTSMQINSDNGQICLNLLVGRTFTLEPNPENEEGMKALAKLSGQVIKKVTVSEASKLLNATPMMLAQVTGHNAENDQVLKQTKMNDVLQELHSSSAPEDKKKRLHRDKKLVAIAHQLANAVN